MDPDRELGRELARLAAEQAAFIGAHRERLVSAFVAETGLLPSECCLVEQTRPGPDGLVTTVVYARKGSPA